MIGSWKRATLASALCLGLAAATASVAQDHPQGPGGPPVAGQRGGPERQKMIEAMRMQREKRLHDLLQIKPDQEAEFHAFTASMTWQPTGRRDRTPTPMTTPERLDRMVARMSERQARFQKMALATKTFYAALTPDQRRAFDAMPMMGGDRRGAWEHGGHGFGGQRG
jgi:Spy/CpxP family protein refolding chaperone